MKRPVFLIWILLLIGLGACNSGVKESDTLLSRDFLPAGWERFDFSTDTLHVKKPVTYDLSMTVTFTPEYPFDYFSTVFTVFDMEEQPLRTKSYNFKLKDREGIWKSDLVDGCYTFTLPINNEMAFNEPGMFVLQLENRMPITPLVGIRHISIRSK
jgi:gliding motility-associated lipoprotein GldH